MYSTSNWPGRKVDRFRDAERTCSLSVFMLSVRDALGDRHSLFRTLMLISTPIRRSLRAYGTFFMHDYAQSTSPAPLQQVVQPILQSAMGLFRWGACMSYRYFRKRARAPRDKVQLKAVDWSREQFTGTRTWLYPRYRDWFTRASCDNTRI